MNRRVDSALYGPLMLAWILMLGGCGGLNPRTDEQFEQTAQSESSIERIRFTQLLAWHRLDDGGLWIELSNPHRTYRLGLSPSCEFALRGATNIGFDRASPNHLSLGDDVLVGSSRCRIVTLTLTQAVRGHRVNASKRLSG